MQLQAELDGLSLFNLLLTQDEVQEGERVRRGRDAARWTLTLIFSGLRSRIRRGESTQGRDGDLERLSFNIGGKGGCGGLRAPGKELTRGPPELVQHLSFIGGAHIGARALHVL